MEETKVEAVIFDCFGVLTTDKWSAYVSTLPEGVDIDEVQGLRQAYENGILTDKEFESSIKDATGKASDYPYFYAADEEIVKNDVLLDYIRELRGRGFRIGLLSNIATNWVRDTFLAPEEQELFDEMILSFEVGMTKPDPRIFMLACERLRVGPHEAVFIDDVDRYCAAAETEGLHAVVYKDFKQMKYELEHVLSKKS